MKNDAANIAVEDFRVDRAVFWTIALIAAWLCIDCWLANSYECLWEQVRTFPSLPDLTASHPYWTGCGGAALIAAMIWCCVALERRTGRPLVTDGVIVVALCLVLWVCGNVAIMIDCMVPHTIRLDA